MSGPKGRPRKDYLLITEKFLEEVTNGLSYKDASRISGASHDTIQRWRDQDKKFNERAFEAQAQFKKKHLQNIDKHSGRSWFASAWLLERNFPLEYAQRQTVALEGNITKEMAERLNAGRERAGRNRIPAAQPEVVVGDSKLLQ